MSEIYLLTTIAHANVLTGIEPLIKWLGAVVNDKIARVISIAKKNLFCFPNFAENF
jgi:hypothetical protein